MCLRTSNAHTQFWASFTFVLFKINRGQRHIRGDIHLADFSNARYSVADCMHIVAEKISRTFILCSRNSIVAEQHVPPPCPLAPGTPIPRSASGGLSAFDTSWNRALGALL